MEPRSKEQLTKANIPYEKHEAHMGHPREFLSQDYILYMENYNRVLISRMMSNRHLEKAHRLLDYTDDKRDIADPYFTNDFSKAFDDISKGIEGFIQKEILQKN
jgi:protein-tyrosine phosphatase